MDASATTNAIDQHVGLIGCGVMGESFAKGMMSQGMIKKGNIHVADPHVDFSTKPWVAEYGVQVHDDNSKCVEKADIVILAVKPFSLDSVFEEMKTKCAKPFKGKLIISLVSGYNLERLNAFDLGTDRIARIMPNIAALVCESATAVSTGPNFSAEDEELVRKIMSSIGRAWFIPEKRMNSWTGSAGAGPAYVFQFIEALADSAVAGGIPRMVANDMAIQTVLGAAKMAKESPLHLAQLRDNVCSPAGVTIMGMQKLHEKGFTSAIMLAVEASRNRYDQVEQNPNV